MSRRGKAPPEPRFYSDDADYAVGYRKPPAATRFKPGTSGNPSGRPKGKVNLRTDIRNVYMTEVRIREGEKTYRVTRLEALLRKQLERAFTGNERATLAACKVAAQLGLLDAPEKTFTWNLNTLSDEELDSFERLMTKIAMASEN